MKHLYERLIDGFFVFNGKTYLGINYKVIHGKLVIYTTDRTISILIGEFEQKISFGVDESKINRSDYILPVKEKRPISIPFTKEEIYEGLSLIEMEYSYPEIGTRLSRTPMSVRVFFNAFKKNNNIRDWMKEYESSKPLI